MLYAGVGYRKRYLQVYVVDEQGRTAPGRGWRTSWSRWADFSPPSVNRLRRWWKRAGTGAGQPEY
jgi:hypothetical protein